MADSLLHNLTETTTPALTDNFYVEVDPGGTPLDRKVTGTSLTTIFSAAGNYPVVFSVTRPNEQKTNSTTNDQDFTSIYTIPANYLVAQKVLRVTLDFTWTADASASSQSWRLKLGSTTLISLSTITPTNNSTLYVVIQYLIFGIAAAGAAVTVEGNMTGTQSLSTAGTRATAGSGTFATNGTLTIVPAVQFGTSTGGESLTLRNAMVESLN